jgi:hypothetical protein
MKPTPAICFAADVKKSRQMEKGRLLSILNEYQQTINQRFHQDLLVPFTIRNGDELIGVIGNFASAYPLIDYILQQSHLHRCPFYLGIGIGKLETTNITDVHAINGSAVLYAFEARDQHLKEKNDKIKIWNEAEAETSFCILAESVPSEPLNTLLGFILSTKRKWTSKQQQVIHLIEQFPEWTYEKIGNHLGYKSPISTVSYLLKRADYQKVKAAEASFTQLLLLYEKLLK